jgi:hypothetical protein
VAVARRLLVLALVLALLAGCGDERRRAGPSPPTVVTIVQDDAEILHRGEARRDAALADMEAIGVDWLRITASWSAIAPSPGAAQRPDFDATDPATYAPGAWTGLDTAVAAARDRGLDVLIDIAFWAPRWATARAVPDPNRQRDGIDSAAYADFAEAVARRYPDVVAFTIWNEPNLGLFWLPQFERNPDAGWTPASPHAYRAMVEAAVPRIEAAAPDALVLIGATSSLGVEEGTAADDRMSPLEFLREMACVDARLQPLQRPECAGFEPLPGDGWSHHPYSGGLPPFERDPLPQTVRMGDLDRLTDLLGALADAGRTAKQLPLYVTEYGYQTNPPDPTWDTTLAEQARWLSEAEKIARDNPAVRSVAQFLLRDVPARPGPDAATRWADFQTGLRFSNGDPKPAFAAYELPLVARREGAGRVSFWGLVRGASGPVPARVELLVPDTGWRPLAEVQTGDDGTFEVSAETDPAGTFRLVSGHRTGAVLIGAR